MLAYFNIGNYKNIPIIPEINYSDVMDGNPDTMAFSFVYDEDLTSKVKLKDKCEVILDDGKNFYLDEVGYSYTGINQTIVINDMFYTVVSDNRLSRGGSTYGTVYPEYETIVMDDGTEYLYIDNVVYLDKRKHYYMCVSQITSEKMSTDADTGYMITITLKEQTVLLKDCIRTDIAITPSLYPEDTNIFSNLYDATLKIVDCHNMCILNDTITAIDGDISDSSTLAGALAQVACPNLTYRDLSTYSQLYDIFMRVGRIPYYSNGTLYGIILQGEQNEEIIDIGKYSSVSNIVEEGINDNIYSSKIYNNIYDNEYAIVPNIFTDLVEGYENQIYSDGTVTDDEAIEDFKVFINSNTTSSKVFESTSSADLEQQMKFWIEGQAEEWTKLQYDSNSDLSKCLLFVNGYNTKSNAVEDARSYSIVLPYDIEYIEEIYACYPRSLLVNNGRTYTDGNTEYWTGVAYYGFALQKLDSDRIVENTIYEQLSTLQKAQTAYYVRGSNKINSIICMKVTENEYTQNDFAWSSTRLYQALTNSFYVVKYKPILNSTYTNYEYVKDLGDSKPLSINNFNLPYSQVSDKQIYPILDYNLTRGSDDTYNVKIVTTDSSILNISAGDIIKYNSNNYIVSKIQSYINNETIECSFCLNDKIIQNSILSSYKDNVRVSSNISAETAVDRQVHIFAENVVELFDGLSYDGAIYNNYDNYNIFTQEIGQNMINSSFYKNGLYNEVDEFNNPEINAYGNLSKYPLRFTKIVPEYEDGDSSPKLFVRLDVPSNSGYKPNDSISAGLWYWYEFKESDFPVTVLLKDYNHDAKVTRYRVKYVANNLSELARYIPSCGMYKYTYKLLPAVSVTITTSFVLNQSLSIDSVLSDQDVENYELINIYSDEYDDYPIITDWFGKSQYFVEKDFEYNGQYIAYSTSNDFGTSQYGTEKLISNSGLISRIDYSLPDSTYSNSEITDYTPYDSTYNAGDGYGRMTTYYANIFSQVPLRFNTSKYGCILQGIGKSSSNFYSLTRLPHISNKGYYIDLREKPRVYIQYKTIGKGSGGLIVKSLSSEFQWMTTITSYTNPVPFTGGAVYKMSKFATLENIDVSKLQKVCDIRSFTKMDKKGIMSMSLNEIIGYDNNYDYCLVLTKDNGDSVNLIKFNFDGYGRYTNNLGISSTIYSNYD